MSVVSVAVIGGGINGAGTAWELVRRGYAVTLFEKRRFGWATSSKTTKMIHGGLRYLEQLQFGLVRESLHERSFLLRHLPSLVRPLRVIFPIYRGARRPPWMVDLGMKLYDALASDSLIPRHRWLTPDIVEAFAPISAAGLRGGFEFWDTQVDDCELVRTVIRCAARDGLDAREYAEVTRLSREGKRWRIELASGPAELFDIAVAVAGPWMKELLLRSSIASRCDISLVRGSHIILDRLVSDAGFLIPSPGERRIVFVLPWKGATMVGTTEVLHEGSLDDVRPDRDEIRYLLDRFNAYFSPPATVDSVVTSFAGVRPLIGSSRDPGAISREYHVESGGRMVQVYGGKMTTFMALGRRVGDAVDSVAGTATEPRLPRFTDAEVGA